MDQKHASLNALTRHKPAHMIHSAGLEIDPMKITHLSAYDAALYQDRE